MSGQCSMTVVEPEHLELHVHDQNESISAYGNRAGSRRASTRLAISRKSLTSAMPRTHHPKHRLWARIRSYEIRNRQPETNSKVANPKQRRPDCIYEPPGRDVSCTNLPASVTLSQLTTKPGNKDRLADAKSKHTTISSMLVSSVSKPDRLSATPVRYTRHRSARKSTDAENQVTSYTYDNRRAQLTEI